MFTKIVSELHWKQLKGMDFNTDIVIQYIYWMPTVCLAFCLDPGR